MFFKVDVRAVQVCAAALWDGVAWCAAGRGAAAMAAPLESLVTSNDIKRHSVSTDLVTSLPHINHCGHRIRIFSYKSCSAHFLIGAKQSSCAIRQCSMKFLFV